MDTLIVWFDYGKAQYLAYDIKIFHPDFSTSILSHINVAMGLFVLLALWLRYWFPLMRGRDTLQHAQNLHLWASFVVWLFTLQEGGSALDMGLNFALHLINRNLSRGADEALEQHLKKIAYRQVMDDAVQLYGVNEAHCRDVISDERIVRSFLKMVAAKLNHNGIQDSQERHDTGNRYFNDLLAKERLHRELIDLPQQIALPWLQE